MKIKGHKITISQIVALSIYYGICYWLPNNYIPLGGGTLKRFRAAVCRRIFKRTGRCINVERKAYFGLGTGIEIGDYSGIGPNSHIPSDTIIGNHVMMAPNCYIFAKNHSHERTDIPMVMQGNTESKTTIIGDDVWIGRNVMMTPGRHIANGSIIAAGCVLSKDFPAYSIVGGNPSRLIKPRKQA